MSTRLNRISVTSFLLMIAGIGSSYAQDVDEVALTFAFPAIGQVYVSAVFRGEQPMLPVSELLHLFLIKHNRTETNHGFRGAFPDKSMPWEIDPVKLTYTYNGEKKVLKADRFFLGETDLFVTPDLFLEIFKLSFVVNPYSLTLSMDKDIELPIEVYKKRQMLRKQLLSQAPENILRTYPMLYPRNRAFFAPGMLDYNVGFNRTQEFTQGTFGLNGGMEVLGGDIQAGMSGIYSNNDLRYDFSSVRWRYVFKGGTEPNGNPLISELNVGQLNLTGPTGLPVRGVSLSNNPLVPRRVLDIFAIEGTTTPDSEIELLIGGQLVDFTRADEVGYYRFNTPLTYGTVRIGLRIYTPQGEVIYEDRQLQIPFNFVPRGILTYNVQAGFQEVGRDSIGTAIVAHGDLSYGLTNNITLRVGANRLLEDDGFDISPYGSVSFRVLDQYLFNVESQPARFTRASASVMYSNNTSFNVQYTDFSDVSVLNLNGEQRTFNVNYFLPVTVWNRASGLRFGLDRAWFNDGEAINYQIDVNTRIGPIITRLNYREELGSRAELQQAGESNRLATAIMTYTIPRRPGLPVFVRGMFFRTSLRHDMKQLDATALGSLQFSQTVFKRGRLTLGYDRDILRKRNTFQVGFLFDFNAVRSATQSVTRYQDRELSSTFNQTFSGSVGADIRNGVIVPTNRDQVGRAGVTVRMFVDENSSGTYDKGEELISSKAVRLDQSSSMLIGSDGMLRITQLQSYWTYRLSVDVTALPDPNLMPLKEKFSFVADPNRFKLIDIPLYRTGTIEGYVYNEKNAGVFVPQPGLRLILHRVGDENPKPPIRTFSDGGFYAFGLIPGDYSLVVDSGQLRFMNVEQVPDTLKFTIRPLPEGDWIDTLEIKLRPARPDTLPEEEPKTLFALENKLGRKLKAAVMTFTESQELFYRGRLKDALAMVDSSLKSFSSDYALALKGSITYLMGNKKGALDLWALARAQNPFIEIPDTTILIVQQDSLWSVEDVSQQLASIDSSGTLDSVQSSYPELMLALEAELGVNLNASIAAFTEAQELFYRRRYEEAEEAIDASLNIFSTDHGLALKGSIAYLLGRRREAWQLWEEARERNPLIELPKTEILDRMISPVTETSLRNGR